VARRAHIALPSKSRLLKAEIGSVTTVPINKSQSVNVVTEADGTGDIEMAVANVTVRNSMQ